MASSSSPPTPPLKKRKLSSSSVEENHRTATTDTAFQYLPDVKTTDCSKFDGELLREEIIGEILVRLPSVKSLIKCTAVCKSWKYLIESPSFIDAHLRRRIFLDQNQVADNDDDQLVDDDDGDVGSLHLLKGPFHFKGYLLYWDKPDSVSASFLGFDSTNSKAITNFSSTLGELTSFDYDLAGTCNGLICLANDEDFTPEVPAIMWNPSVRKFVTLPPSTITIPWTNEEEEENVNLPYYISTSFGYDSRTKDYKVLRIIFSNDHSFYPAGNTPYGVEVYSLARGSWKILSPPPPAPPAVSFPGCHAFCNNNHKCPRNVFVNGAVHWLLPHDQSFGEDVVKEINPISLKGLHKSRIKNSRIFTKVG
ncbi:F-box protein CPR30-like [Pyrus ussuriensis x Pyrus communis]|uniref:F-box protein CPR30-like n=1 Tax=Pyrus ussuriensis x Pyrus communis TaxID=2448454 RepID=A0A5N5HQ45_9ROSA|nr:F-box protein CPR30-like [Pyrus ussuriensis x Pyrus communis]